MLILTSRDSIKKLRDLGSTFYYRKSRKMTGTSIRFSEMQVIVYPPRWHSGTVRRARVPGVGRRSRTPNTGPVNGKIMSTK